MMIRKMTCMLNLCPHNTVVSLNTSSSSSSSRCNNSIRCNLWTTICSTKLLLKTRLQISFPLRMNKSNMSRRSLVNSMRIKSSISKAVNLNTLSLNSNLVNHSKSLGNHWRRMHLKSIRWQVLLQASIKHIAPDRNRESSRTHSRCQVQTLISRGN